MEVAPDDLRGRLGAGLAETLSLALVVPDRERSRTVATCLGEDFERLSVRALLREEEAFLPSPATFFERLKKRREEAATRKRHLLVLGLDAYLALLDEPLQRECLGLVAAWLRDAMGPDATCFLFRHRWPGLLDAATNPRARQGILAVPPPPDGAEDFARTTFLLLPEDPAILRLPRCRPLPQWLDAMAEGEALPADGAPIRLTFPLGGHRLPVFSVHRVTQCPTAATALAALQNWATPEFSEEAARQTFEDGLAGLGGAAFAKALGERFLPGGVNAHVLERFEALQTGADQERFLWVLRHLAKPGTYLADILAEGACDLAGRHAFPKRYIQVPQALLDAPISACHAKAGERRLAIKTLGVNKPFVRDALTRFLRERLRDLPAEKAAPWLGFESEAEDVEWLRRTIAGDCRAYAGSGLLRDYRAPFPPNIPQAIRAYLDDYRVAKCADSVPEAFIAQARGNPALDALEDAESRSARLLDWRDDPTCMLGVIDALGAEYIPFLIQRIQEAGFSVQAEVVRGLLPTDTARNDVSAEWGAARYRKLNDLDKLLHEIPERQEGEQKPDAETVATTFVSILRTVERTALALLRQAFRGGHKRVVITSDHGTTRFATLAWQSHPETVRTIGADASAAAGLTPCGWRMAECRETDGRDAAWVKSPDGRFVSIRGYDRFPCQGGLGFEAHGGATLEERAVPLLVVVQGDAAAGPAANPQPDRRQITEDEDFDI